MNNHNLWAPWRIEYLRSFSKAEVNNLSSPPKCFLCEYGKAPEIDKENLVLWRTDYCLVLFNRFPYTGGHLLVAPRKHVSGIGDLSEKTLLEMMLLTRDAQKVLDQAIRPHGYNIGININRCAGAGLPDHVHLHIVPRWNGDTNFMSVTGNARVISQSLEELYEQLGKISLQLDLPTIKRT